MRVLYASMFMGYWVCMSFCTVHLPTQTMPMPRTASMTGWHSCSDGLSPIIAPVPGIDSAARGVADGYTRSSEMYSGAPTWRGVSNGYVAYMCGGSWAGQWMFTDSEARYLAERAKCGGWMALKPSGQWQVSTGSEWMDATWINATPSISCAQGTHGLILVCWYTCMHDYAACMRAPMLAFMHASTYVQMYICTYV